MSTKLSHIHVRDCMHHGIVSCSADAPVAEVAGLMAQYRVHMVAVTNERGKRPVGVVSDLDLVAATLTGAQSTALQVAATEPLAVSSDASLELASQLMTEHGVSHLVVLDASSGYPVGVPSTLDIAAVHADDCGEIPTQLGEPPR
jgi:CBS domain-containing protein